MYWLHFATVINWFPDLLVIAIFLFAFSTIVSWYYYGLNRFLYLSRKFFRNLKIPIFTYQVLFLVFVVLGAATDLADVIAFSDMMIPGLAFPNLLGLLFFTGERKADLKDYFKRGK